MTRILSIFERAVHRFGKSDVSLWFEFIEYCKRVGSQNKLKQIFVRLRSNATSILCLIHIFSSSYSSATER